MRIDPKTLKRKRYIGPWDRAYMDYLLDQKVAREMEERAKQRAEGGTHLYRLNILVTMDKEVCIGVNPASGEMEFANKIVTEQIYYSWYPTLIEALDKFDEKVEQYIDDILKSKYYECWPVEKVVIKITHASTIIKSKEFYINQ